MFASQTEMQRINVVYANGMVVGGVALIYMEEMSQAQFLRWPHFINGQESLIANPKQ